MTNSKRHPRLFLLLLMLGTITGHTAGQDLRVEFDKLSGEVSYFTAKETKDGKLFEQVTRPKARSGDVVELRVKNMNEFVFRAKTVVHLDRDSMTSEFGSTFSGFLNSTTGFFGQMDFGGFDLDDAFRSVTEVIDNIFGAGTDESVVEDEVRRKLNRIVTDSEDIVKELAGVAQQLDNLVSAGEQLRQLQFSRDLTLDQIRAKRDSLLRELKTPEPAILSASHWRKAGLGFSNKMARARALIHEQDQLWASTNNSALIESRRTGSQDLLRFGGAFNVADAVAQVEEINQITQQLDLAKFEHAESFTIDVDDASQMFMELKVYDNMALDRDPSGALEPGRVVLYYSDRFQTMDGHVVPETCESCKPLKRCEGFVNSSEVLTDLELGITDDELPALEEAYGVWSFWDRDGNLVREQHLVRPDLQPSLPATSASAVRSKVDAQRTIRIPVRRGLAFAPSLGIGISGLFDPASSYERADVSSTTSMILEDELPNLYPTITSLFNFYGDGPGRVHVGGSVGLGVGLATATQLHILMGPNLVIGNRQKVVFSLGISATQVDRLKGFLPVGEEFDDSLLVGSELTTKNFDLGAYFGVSFAVGLKQ